MTRVRYTPRVLRRGFSFLIKMGIVLIPAVMFIIVLVQFTPTLFYQRGNYLGAVFYALLFLALGFPYDVFRIGILRLRELQYSYVLTLFITNTITYLVLSLISRAMINPVPMLVLTLAQIVAILIYYRLANFWYFKIYPTRDSVIVYSDSAYDKDVARKFEAMHERYNIKAICNETEGYDRIIEKVDQYNTCIIGQLDFALRDRIIDHCYQANKRIFVMPSVDDILLRNSHVTQIGDSLVYLIKNRSVSVEQLLIKRLFDLAVSVFFLLLTSPILLIVALAIKLSDGGPVFYRQLRYTRNHKKFNIIKFRSMVVDAEKHGAQFATENDDRITPVGRFIRKTRIDEIPQFFNVLQGDMSIVGPRAERIENHDIYVQQMPEFAYRLKVKAGITGYAQIYGKYNTSFEDKARMDIHYIESYSLLNDIKLLLATVKVVFKKDATEGFESSFFLEEQPEDAEKL